MAETVKLVSNTRIYLDTERLFDEILNITPNFPREYKFTIGADMHHIAVDLLQEIVAAYLNKERDVRILHLTAFQTKFQILKTLIRKAGERQWIKGRSRHAGIIELMDAIGRQSTAWKNSLTKVRE